MITNETVRKVERAFALLAEARGELEAYGASIPETEGWADPRLFEIREQLAQQQAAIGSVDYALHSADTVTYEVRMAWERAGKPEAPERQLLTWEPTKHAGWRGVAGGAVFFTISWHTRRGDPDYVLRSEFPGISLDAKDDDPELLRARAGEAMAAWAAQLGGAS